MLAILCTGLPITNTTAGKWLNNLTFYDDNKCITGNRQTINDVGVNKICHIQNTHQDRM